VSAKHLVALRNVTGATTSYVSLLSIPTASGELKSLGVSDGIAYHSFRVTIDGTVLADAYLSGTASGNVRSNTGLTVGLRFEQSLLVEVSGSVLSPQTTYWAVASTDSSESTNRTQFVQVIDSAPYLFERITYQRQDGSQYNVIVAVGPDRISKIMLDEGAPTLGDRVTGTVELRSGNGEYLSESIVPLVCRINGSRRSHPIVIEGGQAFALANVNGEARFELRQGWLAATLNSVNPLFAPNIPQVAPYPVLYGPYVEIATDLTGYANQPASIELW
jgi:hypothetical protein